MAILLFRIAVAFCFLAVALGAFGAHALRSALEGQGMVDAWNKAVFYQFIHAIALLVLALYGTMNRGACLLLLILGNVLPMVLNHGLDVLAIEF